MKPVLANAIGQEYLFNFYDVFFSHQTYLQLDVFRTGGRGLGKSVFGEIAIPVGSQAEQMFTVTMASWIGIMDPY